MKCPVCKKEMEYEDIYSFFKSSDTLIGGKYYCDPPLDFSGKWHVSEVRVSKQGATTIK
jgi:hypothetical protein